MLHKLVNHYMINQTWRTIKPTYFIPARVTCCPPCPPPNITLTGSKYDKSAHKETDYDKINMKIRRPMSPHLTIYRHELHSNLSITHRMTGVVVGIYTVLLAQQAFILPCQIEYYICYIDELELGAIPIAAMKFILAFPFIYHYFNGIRHLVWDATACCLTMQRVYHTGYIMLACTVLTTSILAFV